MGVRNYFTRRSQEPDPSTTASAAAEPAQHGAADAAPGRSLGRQRRNLNSDDPATMSEDRLDRERLADQMARILQTV
ncbi:hypothetical protein [Nocardioides insulae]|uniref:hypothetical protein n=1 Tax=Nocardioides insulae TaxID=394734 RepID=UPI00146F50F2|nr:hypothetical protein [Nocardioides insulae]